LNERCNVLDADVLLRSRQLPDTMHAMAVSYAGRALASDAIIPLRASGRNEPLAFSLVTTGFRTIVALDPLNRVSITGPSELPR
jgi:hypothetical protein